MENTHEWLSHVENVQGVLRVGDVFLTVYFTHTHTHFIDDVLN